MAVKIIKFNVEYGTLGNCIWRDIEVKDNISLAELGYTLLATFDTCAYHQFEFVIDETKYEIIDEDFEYSNTEDMTKVKLSDLSLVSKKAFTMYYDYGTTQTFNIYVVEIKEMEKGHRNAYPKVVAGEGIGIIDDYSEDEIATFIEQINLNGKTDKPFFYKDRTVAWNINNYDIKKDNALLKFEVKKIAEAYAFPMGE